MIKNIDIRDSLGNKVAGILSIPKNATSVVIFSHGFTSSKASKSYVMFEKELNAKGIGTLRYDYYGHGSNYPSKYGITQDMTLTKATASLQAMIKYVKGKYRICLFGSSFGGLVTLVTASCDPQIDAIILRSPVVEPIKFWKDRLGKKKLDEWKKTGILHYKERGEYVLSWGFWEDLQKYKTLKDAAKIKCPALIVHGDADDITPLSGSKELARILGVKVTVIKGADHFYSNPKTYVEMKETVEKFITETMK